MGMHFKIDLNADLGEGFDTEAALVPLISSANIACGYHAGDENLMRKTIALCLAHGVAVGAHPSFNDRASFGRKEWQLPPDLIKSLITAQLETMAAICREEGAVMHHVKPHGALYNMSARDSSTAAAIAEAVHAFNPSLKLYGLSGSHSIAEAVMAGLDTVAEVFADRRYEPDGSLVSRQQPHALILDAEEAAKQAMLLVKEGRVIASDGTVIEVLAESVCLHGDSPGAVLFAQKIHQSFSDAAIKVEAP